VVAVPVGITTLVVALGVLEAVEYRQDLLQVPELLVKGILEARLTFAP